MPVVARKKEAVTRPETGCIMCRCNIHFYVDGRGRSMHKWRSGAREPCRDVPARKKIEHWIAKRPKKVVRKKK